MTEKRSATLGNPHEGFYWTREKTRIQKRNIERRPGGLEIEFQVKLPNRVGKMVEKEELNPEPTTPRTEPFFRVKKKFFLGSETDLF